MRGPDTKRAAIAIFPAGGPGGGVAGGSAATKSKPQPRRRRQAIGVRRWPFVSVSMDRRAYAITDRITRKSGRASGPYDSRCYRHCYHSSLRTVDLRRLRRDVDHRLRHEHANNHPGARRSHCRPIAQGLQGLIALTLAIALPAGSSRIAAKACSLPLQIASRNAARSRRIRLTSSGR